MGGRRVLSGRNISRMPRRARPPRVVVRFPLHQGRIPRWIGLLVRPLRWGDGVVVMLLLLRLVMIMHWSVRLLIMMATIRLGVMRHWAGMNRSRRRRVKVGGTGREGRVGRRLWVVMHARKRKRVRRRAMGARQRWDAAVRTRSRRP